MKKVFALALALMMIAASLSLQAFAKGDELPVVLFDQPDSYVWSDDYTTCKATYKDQNGNVIFEEDGTVDSTTGGPTCTADTVTTYTATFADEEHFETQIQVIEEGEGLGHDWDEPTYVWAEDYSTCTATRVCKRDPAHTETETVESSSNVISEPEVGKSGETEYTATFTNQAFAEQTERVSTEVLYGDANGDGSVNNKDIVRLKNYLANYDAETGNSNKEIFAGADVNGSGTKDNTDVVRLKRYLMFFDELTGKSMDGETEVVLGPEAH
ncbi:MAG: dockerin type I repeat-containing protein [Clostridia bacterium]|nr:dockerin type I repeat-containing protein [Clostridia bacterium]